MLDAQAHRREEFSFVAKRNCSIAPTTLCALFAGLAAVSLGIAIVWSWQGAWLVLPFAGVEVAALGVALYCHARRTGDFERISVREGRLLVEIGEADRLSRHEFNIQWVRLVLASDSRRRLALRCHGRELEIGRHLDAAGRQRLAAQLRRWLAPAH